MMNYNKQIEDITPEFASKILSRLTFHFVQPKEQKKRSREDTKAVLDGLSKSIMLVEKQIPRKPIKQIKAYGIATGRCSCCGSYVNEIMNPYHCANKDCLQRLDWEE